MFTIRKKFSHLSIMIPFMRNTLFTSTLKGNTNNQPVLDFPNAIPSPPRCPISQGFVPVNVKVLCFFPAMLFYSYLHHFIRNIPALKKSIYNWYVWSSSSKSHMKMWGKPSQDEGGYVEHKRSAKATGLGFSPCGARVVYPCGMTARFTATSC